MADLKANVKLSHCGKPLEMCYFCPVSDLCDEVFNRGAVTVEQSTTQEISQEVLDFYEELSCWALSRIYDLEEQLAAARDTIRRLIKGDAVEWDV